MADEASRASRGAPDVTIPLPPLVWIIGLRLVPDTGAVAIQETVGRGRRPLRRGLVPPTLRPDPRMAQLVQHEHAAVGRIGDNVSRGRFRGAATDRYPTITNRDLGQAHVSPARVGCASMPASVVREECPAAGIDRHRAL